MKKILFMIIIAAMVGVLWKGEVALGKAMETWLSMYGISKEKGRLPGTPTMVWYEGGKQNDKTVVLLHGVGGAALTSWFRLMPELAKQYHVVAPNLYFAGLADIGRDRRYRIAQEQALVQNIMVYLGVERATLVGLSFGSWPAMQVAAALPAKVDGVVLVSPIGPAAAEITSGLDLDSDNPGRDFYYRLFENAPPVPEYFLEEHWERIGRVFKKLPWLMRDIEAESPKLKKAMSKLDCPVLIVFGEKDGIIPQKQFADLAAMLPGSLVAPLPDTGHAVVWDNTAALESKLMEFLKAGDARP